MWFGPTFCRLKSTLSGDEVALPVAEEEAFTGVLDSGKGQMNAVAEGLKEFSRDDLLKLMAKCERWAEEILNLQNKLLQTELERERMALELEEKKAQAEREKMVQQQAKKIENLRSMVLYSNRDRITIALKREINRAVMYYEYQISLSTLRVVKWLKQFVVKWLYLHFTTFIGIIFD
ncbi:hypothetical protein EV1_010165 [Malus domestica]